jgi:hypothetical protein
MAPPSKKQRQNYDPKVTIYILSEFHINIFRFCLMIHHFVI